MMLLQHNFVITNESVNTFLVASNDSTKNFLTFFFYCLELEEAILNDLSPLGFSNRALYDKVRLDLSYNNYNLTNNNEDRKIYTYRIELLDYEISLLSPNPKALEDIFINHNGNLIINRENIINLGDNLDDIFASIIYHLNELNLLGVKLNFETSGRYYLENDEHFKETYLLEVVESKTLNLDVDNVIYEV